MRIQTRRSHVLLATAGVLVTAACGSQSASSDPPSMPGTPGAPPPLTRTVVLTGLNGPWDIAFTPDGAMLYTEKCRGLSVRHQDGTITRLFGVGSAALAAPDLACEGQSGMHGIAVDPAFATNRRVYVFMASNQS
ncbi:MAG TPA: PQQ-dependent sugar dehydrogenase, partial [Gemmatimonadaceae bacterium]|nr:PQQ-dependent sugar dehydrogenase [Gemmatimonadaceae bacterium]